MGYKVIVAGIGPGNEKYILPVAMDAIRNARVIAGGKRALSGLANSNQKKIVIGSDIDSTINEIKACLQNDDVTVMVSGDPGFYSFLVRLKKEFAELEVIPGISSLQMAFARIARPWQNAEFLSLHGKSLDDSKLYYEKGRELGFLTDDNNGPANIAGRLINLGWPVDTLCYVCSNLSYDDELVEEYVLSDMADKASAKNCVVVVTG